MVEWGRWHLSTLSPGLNRCIAREAAGGRSVGGVWIDMRREAGAPRTTLAAPLTPTLPPPSADTFLLPDCRVFVQPFREGGLCGGLDGASCCVRSTCFADPPCRRANRVSLFTWLEDFCGFTASVCFVCSSSPLFTGRESAFSRGRDTGLLALGGAATAAAGASEGDEGEIVLVASDGSALSLR